MAFVTAYKAIVVTTPSEPQTFKIGSISAPSVLLCVRTITTTAVIDGPESMGAEIGVTDVNASLFFPIPFAWISRTAICFTTARVAIISPDIGNSDGDMPNKPSYWAIRYQPGGYTGAIPWHAKVYFDTVK